MELYDGLLALLGQGRLPWLDTLDAIKQALTGDIAKAVGSIAVVIGGDDGCLRRGRIEANCRRPALGPRHSSYRRQLRRLDGIALAP